MNKGMRILYAAGPGDVYGTYRHWKRGEDDPSQVAVTYSSQFFDVCRELGAEAYVVTASANQAPIRDGAFAFRGIPIPFENARGFAWHVGQILYGVRLIACALRFKADVAVVSMGTHWFMLRPLRWFGVDVVPSLHTVLWPPHRRRGMVRRLTDFLDAGLFRRSCAGILCLSHVIRRQVETLTGGRHQPLVPFVPQYRRDWLDGIGAPDPDRRPFRVLFAGRVEPEKGVFDLIAIAKQFRAEGRTDVAFDVCGDGSALDELRARARHEKLEDVVGCHGHCNRDVMRQMLSQSHAVIVPTTTVIGEGMNKVVVEGVLAGRPVVTSSVCPAVEYVDGAAVQVPPEDVAAYADAIRRLCDDRAAYDEHRRQCRLTAEQFYDARLGWGAGLRRILSELARDDKRRPVEAPPSVVRGRSEPVETP